MKEDAMPDPPLKPATATFTFMQDEDSVVSGDQFLRVEVDDAGAGPFLSIQTERWSLDVDQLDMLVQTLRWCAAQTRGVFTEEEREEEERFFRRQSIKETK